MHEYFSDISSYEDCMLPGVHLPLVKIDEKYYQQLNIDPNVDNFTFLKTVCERALIERGLVGKEYKDRLELELNVVKDLGFTDYFILNFDILNFCHVNNILTGDGRGSACSSLILFLIKVTKVDPVKYGLIFERFINKSRAKKIEKNGEIYLDGSLLPDIDSDFLFERRFEVIEYINTKHKGRTSKILTLGALTSKVALKEVAKMIGGMSETSIKAISDLIPMHFGKAASIEDACKQEPKFKTWIDENPRLAAVTKKIEGLIKNVSVHPSGIAISRYPIEDLCPVQKTKDGDLVAGYDMHNVGRLMVKFDILGLRTLTVVNNACKSVGITAESIDVEDPFIYDSLQDLRAPHGLFQIEASTNLRVCKKIKPKNIHQLSHVISIGRPGSISYLDAYISNNEDVAEDLKNLNYKLYNILKPTNGQPLFQEQLSKIAHQVLDFSLDEAEIIRKIAGKKLTKEVAEWEPRVYANAKRLGLDKSIPDFFWKLLFDSANYSFCASHAYAYSFLAAKTTYLKNKYPLQFYLSLLNSAKFEQDPHGEINTVSKELLQCGIKLLPPDLAKSELGFCAEDGNIRFGLSSIKGVAEAALIALTSFRESKFPNKFDIFISAKQSGLNIGVLCALIQAGCLSSYSDKRSRLTLEAQIWNILTDGEKRFAESVGAKYNYDILEIISQCAIQNKVINEKGKPFMSEKRLATFKEKYSRFKEIYEHNRKHEKFTNWWFEQKILSYSPSARLKTIFNQPESNFTDTVEFESIAVGDEIKMVGICGEVFSGVSKKNNKKYVRISLKDEVGQANSLFMDSDKKARLTDYLEEGLKIPKEGEIIVLKGRRGEDILWLESISIMDEKVFMKLSELKD